ncbi:MAG: T9SS type A sorting domain-containing protein [Bacteroidetes bacterium]|nr:T9SS type A sorting domain-containing protein [Bacteroidota bacterium]
MKTKITFIILLLSGFLKLQSQTNIPSGDVFGEWKIDGSPYLIQGNIHIPSQKKLSIEAGVKVVFQGSFSFEIEGKMEAVGSETDSITFTLQDTAGFSQGNQSGWYGLSFTGYNYSFSDNSVLTFCNIEFSETNGISCLSFPFLQIENSTIRYNKNAGLALFQFSDVVGENLHIHDNGTGGIITVYSSPAIYNFIIDNNDGSGISLYGNSSGNPLISFINGKITNNNGFMYGGGLNIGNDSQVLLDHVEILNNSAVHGGGIFCAMATGLLRNSTLMHNEAENGGGVFCSDGANLSMEYSLIARNMAAINGGGAKIADGTLNLQNCTLSGNSAGESGGGLYYDLSYPALSQISSSILWDNQPQEIVYTLYYPEVNYSDIKGGFAGIENFDADPLFIDPLMSNYHLTWYNFPQENGIKSPCIDSGNPESEPDPDGTPCDVGAFFFDQGVYTIVNQKRMVTDFAVYPNPTKNFITISGEVRANRIRIVSLSGAIVLEQEIENAAQPIDVNFLNAGVYILNLYQESEIIGVNKFIKK